MFNYEVLDQLYVEMNGLDKSLKGVEYLSSLSILASELLEVQYLFIGKLQEDEQRLRTDFAVDDGDVILNFEFDASAFLSETNPNKGKNLLLTNDFMGDYPQSILSDKFQIKACSVSPLVDSDGETMGLLVLACAKDVDEEALKLIQLASQLLATRVGMEYRLLSTDSNLNTNKKFLSEIIREKEMDIHTSLSALHQKNEELEKTLKDKHNLLSTILHDISNPLMAATTNIGLFEINEDSKHIENARDALTEVINITTRIRKDYKEAMGHRPDKYTKETEHLTISDLVDYANLIFADRLEDKKLNLNLVEGGEIEFETEASAFKNSVFNNLISNAIKFSPVDSQIDICARKMDGKLEIEIRDHGEGISQDVLDQLKDDNPLLNSSVGTSGEKGTGLGIQSAVNYVKNLGGNILFERLTEGEGGGTNVNIVFE